MKKLLEGVIEFRKTKLPQMRDHFEKLSLGQSPDALMIACSDSRVAPNLFASTNPGDLFVIRNPGNLIPPWDDGASHCHALSEASAIEIAVETLHVKNIILCGHSRCALAKALTSEGTATPIVEEWKKVGLEARERYLKGQSLNPQLLPEDQISQLNVMLQIEHVLSYPRVRERYEKKELGIHAWWFDITNGDLLAYEPELGHFVVIDEPEAERISKRLK